MRALWSDRQICSHNVSQKLKRIRRLSEFEEKTSAILRGSSGGFCDGLFLFGEWGILRRIFATKGFPWNRSCSLRGLKRGEP